MTDINKQLKKAIKKTSKSYHHFNNQAVLDLNKGYHIASSQWGIRAEVYRLLGIELNKIKDSLKNEKRLFTCNEIKSMSVEEFTKHRDEIEEQLREGLIK